MVWGGPHMQSGAGLWGGEEGEGVSCALRAGLLHVVRFVRDGVANPITPPHPSNEALYSREYVSRPPFLLALTRRSDEDVRLHAVIIPILLFCVRLRFGVPHSQIRTNALMSMNCANTSFFSAFFTSVCTTGNATTHTSARPCEACRVRVCLLQQ